MPYAPVIGNFPITSGFGGRSSPGGIGSTNHKGIDIGTPIGTQVVAPTDITIARAGPNGGYGNYIGGYDQNGQYYEFAHLSEIGVSPGQTVAAGSIIGATGNTGNSTGPHLHFGIKDAAGKYLNPSSFLSNATQLGSGLANKALASARKVVDTFLKTNPATAPFAWGADALGFGIGGGGEECASLDFVCKLKKWFKEGDFYRRIMFILVGLILLWAAFTILARTQVMSNVTKAVKG